MESATENNADEAIREIYRQWASGYDAHMQDTNHYAAIESLLENIIEHIPKNSFVLDPSCGTGALAKYISDKRPDLCFLLNDASPEMLAVAREKFAGDKRVKFTNYDIHQLPEKLKEQFEEEGLNQNSDPVFPTILLSYTMYWVGNQEEKQQVAECMYKLLTDNGRVISIEEWPLVVTKTPVSEKLEKQIKKSTKPMEPGEINWKVFVKAGFGTWVAAETAIDDKHSVRMRVYCKR